MSVDVTGVFSRRRQITRQRRDSAYRPETYGGRQSTSVTTDDVTTDDQWWWRDAQQTTSSVDRQRPEELVVDEVRWCDCPSWEPAVNIEKLALSCSVLDSPVLQLLRTWIFLRCRHRLSTSLNVHVNTSINWLFTYMLSLATTVITLKGKSDEFGGRFCCGEIRTRPEWERTYFAIPIQQHRTQ